MSILRMSPLFDTDSYKASHYLQYPPGTTGMFSYLEARGGEFPAIVFYGILEMFEKIADINVTKGNLSFVGEFLASHGVPFNIEGWEYFLDEYNGSFFEAIKIKHLPEGTVTKPGVALVTMECTDPKCFWLVGWLETFLMRVWYPTTVCTLSWTIKQIIRHFMELTCDSLEGLEFKLHDFGSRGVSSYESAVIGGSAHLMNFLGTDNLAALFHLTQYHDFMAYSIPAAEHSTITSWGRENEARAYENMLDQFSGHGKILAVVSDSYDLFNAIDNIWGDELKDKIISTSGTLVIRPDSGDPEKIVLECLRRLEAKFGAKVNSKGYKVLNHVRLIQGDGVNKDSILDILSSMTHHKYSTENIAFGMGGALLQGVNRDTCRFAIKCSAILKDGEWIDVYKDPITDPGKRSKRGRLKVISNGSDLATVGIDEPGEDVMVEVTLGRKDRSANPNYMDDQEFPTARERLSHYRLKNPIISDGGIEWQP